LEIIVDPVDRHGLGHGRYRLLHRGVEQWSGERPWMLRDACVTDGGMVFGFAQVRDPAGVTLHLIAIDEKGATLMDAAVPRNKRGLDSSGHGAFYDERKKQITYRVANPNEVWWTYQCPQMTLIDERAPWRNEAVAKRRVIDVVPLRGTPLRLVQSMDHDAADTMWIVLQDSSCKTVWAQAWPNEFEMSADKTWGRPDIRRGTVSNDSEAGCFRVRLPKSRVDVHWRATLEDGSWRVNEVARHPHVAAADTQALTALPDARLVLRGCVQLRNPPLLRDPFAANIDVLGRAIVQDDDSGSIHVFDEHGRVLFVCHPDAEDLKRRNMLNTFAATRARGLVAWRGFRRGHVRFDAKGERRDVVEAGVWSLICAVHRDESYGYSFEDGLAVLDSDYKRLVTIERGPDGRWLTLEGSLAIDSDGNLACVDSGLDEWRQRAASAVIFAPEARVAVARIAITEDLSQGRIAIGKGWLVVTDLGGRGLMQHLRDGRRFRITMPGEGKHSWKFGFSEARDELLALDVGEMRLYRWALP
jgi:hypothetical protein